jgi:hypothetical protein
VNIGGGWWKVSDEGETQHARWLGLLRRQVKLHTHTPGKFSVPSLRIPTPQGLLIPDSHSALLSNSLTVVPLVPPGKNLVEGNPRSLGSQAGSVSLAGVMLNDQRDALPPLPIPTQATERYGKDVRLIEGQGVPLSKRLAYLLQPPTDLLLSGNGPLEWPGTLFEFQLEGVRALISREALLLADDMGLGKTIQAAAALRILVLQHKVESALLIVRAGLINQWRKELRRWAPELRISTIQGPVNERAWQWGTPAHAYIVSYETFRSDFTDNPHSPPRRRVWDIVILDEAQAIKNCDTEVSRKCKLLYRLAAWALTGTPLENSISDLISILEFVAPLKEGESPKVLKPGSEIYELHKTLQLRRKKSDVLPQLPPKIVSKIEIRLEGSQWECYEQAEKEGVIQLQERGESIRVENVLELIMRLKQICNFCPITAQSAKLDDIRERLNILESEEQRALIFSQFTDDKYGGRAIASALHLLQPLLYTGDLSASQKEATIREFKENRARKVLVLSLRAGGQGLNLQEASYVFHFDRWWNPAVEHQAEDRSHRFGQTLPVNVYKYMCEATIEERIDQILQEKQLLFDELVDDVSLDLKSKLTTEDLFGLFGLTPPEHVGFRKRSGKPSAHYAEMTGIEFEEYVKHLLENKKWHVETTPVTRDGGIDLIARRLDDIGVEVVLYVQCKNHVSPVGVDVARELNGALPKLLSGVRGVIVCPSGFTPDAISFAKDREIVLWDRHHLFELLGE